MTIKTAKKDGTTVMDADGKAQLLLHKSDDEERGLIGTAEPPTSSHGASFIGAVFNLSTTIIGAGIMALPAAMKVLGLVPGIAAIVFVALLAETSIEMLLRFSRAGGSVTYVQVMGDAFGRIGRMVLLICVLINNIGMLVVYMIIIGDVLSGTSASGIHHAGVLEGWFGEHWWTGRAFVLLMTTLCVFAPLACFKRIESLRFSSAVAVILAIVFLVITAGITTVKLINGSITAPRLLPNVTDMNSVWKLFTVVPVLNTAYVCHFNVHFIGNELQDSSSMQSVVRASLALCCAVYIMTSVFGFLLFGESTLDDVLANFDTNLGIAFSSQLSDAVRVSYALHVVLVFPVMFYALRLYLDNLLFPSTHHLESNNYRFTLISIGLLCVAFVSANFIPSIWDAFQFTGSTASVCLGFIFPGAIALRDPSGVASRKDKILSIFMICLAVLSSLVAIYSNAYALLTKKNTSQSCDLVQYHSLWNDLGFTTL